MYLQLNKKWDCLQMEAEKLVNLNTTQEAHVQRSETQSVMTNATIETRFGPKKNFPNISRPKKSQHFLLHWMSVKLPDNFQMREHSWACRFHINNTFITHRFRVSVVSDVSERVRDFRITSALYVKKILSVLVCYTERVYKASNFCTHFMLLRACWRSHINWQLIIKRRGDPEVSYPLWYVRYHWNPEPVCNKSHFVSLFYLYWYFRYIGEIFFRAESSLIQSSCCSFIRVIIPCKISKVNMAMPVSY
jgi:hypothetical protein